MNKLSFLLVTAALFICGYAQESNKKQVTNVHLIKRTLQADSLEITAVDSIEYRYWHCRFTSIDGAWGVRVRITNNTDQKVSKKIEAKDIKIRDITGKKYSLPELFTSSCWVMINQEELFDQHLQGSLFIFSNGTEVKINDGDVDVGGLGSHFENDKTILYLTLSPKKSIMVVFVFDSPKESKPQTLFWPSSKGSKPIDLR